MSDSNKPIILLMLSGGLDSLGCLYLLLTKPEYSEYSIHTHHMRLINVEKRHLAEDSAVKNILNYFKSNPQYRPFTHSQNTLECPAFNGAFMWDVDAYNFMAGVICDAVPNIKYVAIGRTKTDLIDLDELPIGRSDAILNLLTQRADIKILPVIEYTKQEIWDFLPGEVRRFAWSCRTPSYTLNMAPVPCGECKPCKILIIK